MFFIFLNLVVFSYAAGSVEEVTVKADVKLEVKSDKPELDMQFSEKDVFTELKEIEEYIFDLKPENLENVFPAIPKIVYSRNIVCPQYINILENSVVKFRTETVMDVFAKKWELIVTDARGEVFTQLKGKKDVPDTIDWDGRNEKGDMLVPGQWYSYSILIRDEYGDNLKINGDTFKIKGVYYKDRFSNQIISLSLVDMFDIEATKTKITEQGEELLEEALNYIKMFYEYPIELVVYDSDDGIGMKKGEVISEYIAANLNVEELDINISVIPSYISEYKIDIIVLNI